jgi:hypothetical protein
LTEIYKKAKTSKHFLKNHHTLALTIERLKQAVEKDKDYHTLVEAVLKEVEPKIAPLHPYLEMDGLVMRGERIVIPQADLGEDIGNLRQWVVELGHDGHVGAPGIKRRWRIRVWFPGMDTMVEEWTKTCWGCTVSTKTHDRDSLRPTTAPDCPFKNVAAEYWGPTPEGKHILVVKDLLTRFPEVVDVKGSQLRPTSGPWMMSFPGISRPPHS